MGNSRPTKKAHKIMARSARRRLNLKNQSFKPVIKSVDVDRLKKEFEAKLTPSKTPENTEKKD